jgi:hypothetical protein
MKKRLQSTQLHRKTMAVPPFQYLLGYLINYPPKESLNEDDDFWMFGSTYVPICASDTSLNTCVAQHWRDEIGHDLYPILRLILPQA